MKGLDSLRFTVLFSQLLFAGPKVTLNGPPGTKRMAADDTGSTTFAGLTLGDYTVQEASTPTTYSPGICYRLSNHGVWLWFGRA